MMLLLLWGELRDRPQIRQPQASKHLRVLYEVGIVDEENHRIYKLRLESFKELNYWLDQYLELWEEKFDNLNCYLQALPQNKISDGK